MSVDPTHNYEDCVTNLIGLNKTKHEATVAANDNNQNESYGDVMDEPTKKFTRGRSSAASNNNFLMNRGTNNKYKNKNLLTQNRGNGRVTDNNSNNNNKKVINISTYELIKDEIKVLSKGLNFAVAPNRIPNEEIICDIEEGIKYLNDEDKDKVRQECTIILDKAKLPKKNLSSEQLKALKNLRGNDKIVIRKADKGGATVVMDK